MLQSSLFFRPREAPGSDLELFVGHFGSDIGASGVVIWNHARSIFVVVVGFSRVLPRRSFDAIPSSVF